MKKIKIGATPTEFLNLFLVLSLLAGFMPSCKKYGSNNQSALSPLDKMGTSTATASAVRTDTLRSPATIAFVEVNDNNIADMGCYVSSSTGKPIVNVASIFAGNINISPTSNKPVVYLNSQVTYLLTQTTYVKDLQAQGIKVTLALLNNHDASGWSDFADSTSAAFFAQSVKTVVTKYGLEGIDIDDEYSAGTGTTASIPMAVAAIRKLLPNTYIGFYLYSDQISITSVLAYKYKDGTKFTDGISYALPDYGVSPSNYTTYLPKKKLFYTDQGSAGSSTIGSDASSAKTGGYGGIMIFNANASNSQTAFTAISKSFGTGKLNTIGSSCLKAWAPPTSNAGTYIEPAP